MLSLVLASNNVTLLANAGIALIDVDVSIERQLISIEEVLTINFDSFKAINVTCDKRNLDAAQKFNEKFDLIFIKNLENHIENYFSNPVPKRKRRDLWNAIDSAINLASQIILHRKITNTLNSVDGKIAGAFKLMSSEFNLLKTSVCNQLTYYNIFFSTELANCHMTSSVQQLDNILFFIINNVQLHQVIPKLQLRACARYNSIATCRELIINHRIKNRLLAIEHNNFVVRLQMITTFPAISEVKRGVKVVNIGLLKKTKGVITKSKILNLSNLYIDSYPVDINQCSEITDTHFMCYSAALESKDQCFFSLINSQNLSSCYFEKGETDQMCTVRDLADFYLIQLTDHTPLLGVGEDQYGNTELPPGNHIICNNVTKILGCTTTHILHPTERITNFSVISQDFNFSIGRYVDRDFISILENPNILLSDTELLETALNQVLSTTVIDNIDVFTILIIIIVFFLIVFMLVAYLYFKNHQMNKIPLVI